MATRDILRAGDTVIAHGLNGRADLNGKPGRVQEWMEDRGRCAVRFTGGEIVSVKRSNLALEDVYEDMVTVDGLCYCQAHRLEICGACGYNFRMQNRLSELNWDPATGATDELYVRAERMDTDEARDNQPPRRAPGSANTPEASGFHRSQLASRNLDPRSFQAWDHDGSWPLLEVVFGLTFSQAEVALFKAGRHKDGGVEFQLRQTLHVIAKACDKAHGVVSINDMANGTAEADIGRQVLPQTPIPTFTIQDNAQSEAVMLQIVTVHETGKLDVNIQAVTGELYKPLLVVRYMHQTVAGITPDVLDAMQAGLRLQPDGAEGQQIGADVDEVRLFAKMLEANRARLKPEFVAHASRGLPRGWHVSVLQPVLKHAHKEAASCPVCGLPARSTCTRCKQQQYCSADCQKAHWRTHKATCRAPEGAIATVSIAAAQADAEIDEQMARMAGMNLHSNSLQSSLMASKGAMFNFEGVDDESLQKIVPIKLQVPTSDPTLPDAPSPTLALADPVLRRPPPCCCRCRSARARPTRRARPPRRWCGTGASYTRPALTHGEKAS